MVRIAKYVGIFCWSLFMVHFYRDLQVCILFRHFHTTYNRKTRKEVIVNIIVNYLSNLEDRCVAGELVAPIFFLSLIVYVKWVTTF